MLSLKDVADYVAGLDFVPADHIWIGKLQDKVDKSVGIYPLRRTGLPHNPVGGTDHDVKRISILVHWNNNVVETEEAAYMLFDSIMKSRNVVIHEKEILFNQMQVPEPINVGTDANGIYEYVIEFDIYYKR